MAETYRIHAIRYARHARKAAENFIGGDDHATFVDLGPDLDPADEQALAGWLRDPSRPKIVQPREPPSSSPSLALAK